VLSVFSMVLWPVFGPWPRCSLLIGLCVEYICSIPPNFVHLFLGFFVSFSSPKTSSHYSLGGCKSDTSLPCYTSVPPVCIHSMHRDGLDW